MPRWIESWLPGSPVGPNGRVIDGHSGEQFGLPASGVGSVVGFGRRFAALTVDWLLAYLIAALLTGSGAIEDPTINWRVLGVWFLLAAALVAVFGASTGMAALGIRVTSIDGVAMVGVPRALLRTALVALVLPALARDADGRGLHDRATRTIVVHTRA